MKVRIRWRFYARCFACESAKTLAFSVYCIFNAVASIPKYLARRILQYGQKGSHLLQFSNLCTRDAIEV